MFTPFLREELIAQISFAHFTMQAGNHESGTDIFSDLYLICLFAMPRSCLTFIVEDGVRNH